MEINETWVSAKNFESYYEVSNLGRVRRLPRKSRNSRNHNSFKNYGLKLLSLKCSNSKRYITCKLSVNGIISSIQLHRLVLESFNPINKLSMEVNHIDGNKHNNSLSNLEWVTSKENKIHAVAIGLNNPPRGENNGKSKVTSDDVIYIKKLLRSKEKTHKEISELTGASLKMISDINTGRTWRQTNV